MFYVFHLRGEKKCVINTGLLSFYIIKFKNCKIPCWLICLRFMLLVHITSTVLSIVLRNTTITLIFTNIFH